METRITEVGHRIYRLSTFVKPANFMFNQFLIDADEPLLFHTGMRSIFSLVSAAVARIMPPERLRWITFGHYEADECGAMNEWLALAPRAEVAHSAIGVMVSINDQVIRPARALGDGEVIDLGGKRVRRIETPHVPHGWDAGLFHEQTTGTLFTGDLFTATGDGPAITSADPLAGAIAAEADYPRGFSPTVLAPTTGATIRRLAELAPTTLATMHASTYTGDGATALRALAAYYDERFAAVAVRA